MQLMKGNPQKFFARSYAIKELGHAGISSVQVLMKQPIGTTLEMLMLSPSFLPPKNPKYGCTVKEFVVSKIHSFGGKSWQLRAVQVHQQEWKLLPFVVNTGGSPALAPIIGSPAMQALGFNFDRDAAALQHRHDHLFLLPAILGPIKTPLATDWSHDRIPCGLIRETYDIRANLLGSELARSIIDSNAFVKELECYKDADAVYRFFLSWRVRRELRQHCQTLARMYKNFGATEASAMRELQALMRCPDEDPGKSWTEDKLPIPDELF